MTAEGSLILIIEQFQQINIGLKSLESISQTKAREKKNIVSNFSMCSLSQEIDRDS